MARNLTAREWISLQCATVNTEPSKTQQGHAYDADINNIAKSYGLTPFGKMPLPEEAMDPRYYGDMSDAGDMDLQTAMNRVFEAQEHFDRLPANIRSRFGHNPAELWAFLQSPDNVEEAITLGILNKPPAKVVTNEAIAETPPA